MGSIYRYGMAVVAISLISMGAIAAYEFGSSGYDGRDGYDGESGRSGEDIVFKAQGQSLQLNLDGSDGRDARDGQDGSDASNCYQGQPAYSLVGASGGDGGDGGTGGRGGSGGDIMIYAADVSNLQKIAVLSRPGDGGRGGRPGRGGYGCSCSIGSWSAESCYDEKQDDGTYKEVCTTSTYYCTSGSTGSQGRDGSDGSRGSYGSLTLVKRLEDLEPVTPGKTVTIGEMVAQPLVLSDNIWIQKTGAKTLLAPGSVVSDQYREFSHKQQYPVAFVWKARRAVEEFAAQKISMAVNAAKTAVSIRMPAGVWFQVGEENVGGTQQVTIEKILYAKEADQLTMKVAGAKTNYVGTVTDSAGVSDLLQTGFRLKLEHEKFFGDKVIFNGVIPKEYITTDGKTFTINIGKLPGIPKDELDPGDEMEIDLSITRQLGSFSTVKRINFKQKIPKK